MGVPKFVAERLTNKLKSFQALLEQQRDRDVSEADTVNLVKDLLSDLFGYEKCADLSTEEHIRGNYCRLAVKLDGKLSFLLEVKPIGADLKDSYLKQTVDYASKQGCDHIVLTNAVVWRLYKVIFKMPIEKQEVMTLDLLSLNVTDGCDIERLFLLSREGFTKDALGAYLDRRGATNCYILAAIILHSWPVQNAIRREILRVSEIIADQGDVEKILREEVLKRETIQGEAASVARQQIAQRDGRSDLNGIDCDML